MRELKFRAWDRTYSKWRLYSLGDLVGGHTIYDEDMWNCEFENWCQYAGLKDKNGKEIYEGDLIKIEPYKYCGEIKWQKGQFIFNLSPLSPRPIWSLIQQECELIGNIYENPDLLSL